MFKRVTTLLAILGLGFAIYIVATARQPIPAPPPAYPPSVNPFKEGIVGLGIVEPSTRVIDVSPPEPGRVFEVFVQVGAKIEKGAPLFSLDTTLLEAEMIRLKASRDAAAAELKRQESWPRKEDIPALKAAVDQARTKYDDAADRLRSLEQAHEQDAANPDELARQRFLTASSRATYAQAQANLDKYLSGPWDQDVAVARANLAAAQAEIDSLKLKIDRLTTRATISGTVLKRDLEPGEYVQPGGSGSGSGNGGRPVMSIGDLEHLRIRAQVDEEDTPLLQFGAKAVARVRGPFKIELPLKMLRIEPLARPKQQISNAAAELVDTRVIDVVFEVEAAQGVMLYPGQVLDVYIEVVKEPKSNRNL